MKKSTDKWYDSKIISYLHIAASLTVRCIFDIKIRLHFIGCRSFFEKSHAWLICSVASILTMTRCRYKVFSRGEKPIIKIGFFCVIKENRTLQGSSDTIKSCGYPTAFLFFKMCCNIHLLENIAFFISRRSTSNILRSSAIT